MSAQRETVLVAIAAMALVDPSERRGDFSHLTTHNTASNGAFIGSAVLATTDIVSNSVISSDAALVHITGTSIVPDTGVIQKADSTITINSYGGARNLAGRDAEIIGGYTNSVGDILNSDVTVSAMYIEGGRTTLTDHAIAEYWSRPGDSGSPILHTDDNGTSSLIGIHVGSIRIYTIESTGEVVHQGERSATARDANRSGQFGIFSPWENVARDLRIPAQ